VKKCLGAIRKASDEFGLIEDGDCVAVGVSGGKDSVALLFALKEYQRYANANFSFFGVCVDLGNENFDVSSITRLCTDHDIDFHVVVTDIAKIVFDVRKEKSPCSLCAKLRKGALINEAKRLGANKLALGHHRDDLLETFILCMMYEGRLNALAPKTYLDRKDITQIRPMIYLEESHIINFVKKYDLPTCKSFCRVDGDTKRSEAKEIIAFMKDKNTMVRKIMTTAITKPENYKLWEKAEKNQPN
jgi:tRNA 2-thiocytidine biosynthesis protein TtcA